MDFRIHLKPAYNIKYTAANATTKAAATTNDETTAKPGKTKTRKPAAENQATTKDENSNSKRLYAIASD